MYRRTLKLMNYKKFELVTESIIKSTYLINSKSSDDAEKDIFNLINHRNLSKETWDFDLKVISTQEID